MESETIPAHAVASLTRDELTIARKTLEAMVPQRLPALEGIDMASLYLPCERLCGDLFDVKQIADDVLAFVMFDVACHGISSVLVASMAKVTFTNHLRHTSSPQTVIDHVNTDMAKYLSATSVMTAFVGYLDLHSNKLTYCNAGHPYPMVFRTKDKSLEPLKTAGVFLGISEKWAYEERTVYLNPGDWLVMFTNGFYGLFDDTNKKKGRERFEQDLPSLLEGKTPGEFIRQCGGLQRRKADKGEFSDDVAIVAVEILTESRRNLIKHELGFEWEDPVYMQFISYFEEMDNAIGIVLKSMDNQGYADDTIRKMKITLTELIVNALYHGNRKEPSKKVIIGHIIDKQKAVVSIMDEGDGFDPSAVPDPTLPENLVKDSGRGLYIVRCYVDDLTFNKRGNRVTVSKKFDLQVS